MIQNQDQWIEDEQYVQSTHQTAISKLNDSLFNKSCINTVNMMSLMIRELPQLPNIYHIQRLNISNNYLKKIPMNLHNLKQLIANKNCIQNIPQEIEQMTYLRILKLNNNKIRIIPFFKNIVCLQLLNNPIILVSNRIPNSNIKILTFDWIQFLVPNNSNPIDNYYQFIRIMNKITNQLNPQYLTFKQLFEIDEINNQQSRIATLLHKAINQNFQFFISYLRSYAKQFDHNINFNRMNILGKLLLGLALKTDKQQIIKLFMMRKSNLNSNQIFWSNLELACQYSHKGLFDYIISNKNQKLKIWQKSMQLLSKALINFNITKNTDYIVQKIIKYSKMPFEKKQKIVIPKNYSIRQGENIANGLSYILENYQLYSLLSLDQDNNYLVEQPLLHFAARTKNVNLIYQLIRFNFCPFKRNIEGITPKMVKGTIISKKFFWKIQKTIISSKLIKSYQYEQSIKQNIQNDCQIIQQESVLDENPLPNTKKFKSQIVISSYRSNIITSDHILSQKQQQPTPNNYQRNSYNFKKQLQQDSFQKSFSKIKKYNNNQQLYQQFHNMINQNYQHQYNQQIRQQQSKPTQSRFRFCQDVPVEVGLMYYPRRIPHKRKITLLAK